jgi:carbon storage regulator
MLVLSRKLGERILVPHTELTVTVVAIDANTVKLGITAPTDVGVYREELWRKVCAENVAPQAPAGAAPVKSRNGANFASGLGISGAAS